MPHRIRKLLIDLTLSCEKIIEFSSGKSFEDFLDDRLLQLAIEREFEIIGEALSLLSRIDEMVLWDFAQNKVPELLNQVRNFK